MFNFLVFRFFFEFFFSFHGFLGLNGFLGYVCSYSVCSVNYGLIMINEKFRHERSIMFLVSAIHSVIIK